MPAVKNVGEPCAGEPHARFEVAAGGNQTSRASTCRAVQAPPVDPPVWVSSPTKHGCDSGADRLGPREGGRPLDPDPGGYGQRHAVDLVGEAVALVLVGQLGAVPTAAAATPADCA